MTACENATYRAGETPVVSAQGRCAGRDGNPPGGPGISGVTRSAFLAAPACMW